MATTAKAAKAKRAGKTASKKAAKKAAKKRLKKELEEKASRRRGVTAKKKAGVYRDYGHEATEGNRRKRSIAKKRITTGTTKHTASEKSQVRTGASEEPEYRNIEKSSREERTWDGDTHEGVWKEEVGVRGGRGDKERYKTRGRDQQEQKKRRLQIRDEETERRKPRHDPYYYSRPRRRRAGAVSRWRRFYRLNEQVPYFGVNDPNANSFGEHPASAGRAEYLGGNKRHPGLIGRKRRVSTTEDRSGTQERSSRRRQRRSDSREPLTHKTSTKLAIKDYRNRNQYGMSDFHPMQMYDPVEVEHELEEMDDSAFDHMYQDEGYQHAGNTEGFGRRGGRQSYYGWEDEDEYREGHAVRKRGYGKYGSR